MTNMHVTSIRRKWYKQSIKRKRLPDQIKIFKSSPYLYVIMKLYDKLLKQSICTQSKKNLGFKIKDVIWARHLTSASFQFHSCN